jgi:hypothetical protein
MALFFNHLVRRVARVQGNDEARAIGAGLGLVLRKG